MNKYEAMVIIKPDLTETDSVKPDLPEEQRKALFQQINDVVTKNNGSISQSGLWQERKKLFFPINKYNEGVYYLLNFASPPLVIKDIRHAYKLNENILRVLITKLE
ncbi:MAG: 30S ribosomal protein S6 [Candidatus Omnitrophica bacterium]|nr:30S ribosomal protein S6 [Candidatus Omnitrophota bacterium]